MIDPTVLTVLIEQIQAMVNRGGDPAGFDAAKWLTAWLDEPLPALGGACPAEYLDTQAGQAIVSDLLAMMESGAYA